MSFKLTSYKDHILIGKTSKSTTSLQDVVKDVDLNAYIIVKATNRISILTTEEFLDSSYARYILEPTSDKRLYEVKAWINFLNEKKVRIYYLQRLLPDFNITNRITV